MPSYTKEQRNEALKVLEEECEWSVTAAINRLGYPSRQTMYQWISQADALHERTAGRPWSHYDPALRRMAVKMVGGGLEGSAVASMLGVSSGAVVHNWVRKAQGDEAMRMRNPKVDGPIEVTGDEPAWSGFEGSEEERIEQLQLENDTLRGVVEVSEGASLSSLTNREKTLLVNWLRQTTDHRLKDLIAFLRISKSSYEYQSASLRHTDRYDKLRGLVVEIFNTENRTRGYRFVWAKLRQRTEPVFVSEKVVRRIMSEEGCKVIYNKAKRHYSSYDGEISEAPEDLVKRNFHAEKPNELWLTDITEFATPCGKAYLSPVVDCFDGKLVSWRIGTSPNAELANGSLEDACASLRDGEHPVSHSDRGCHYRWPGWIRICKENGITRSMSKKGCSPDNSACEGLFGRLKNEFFYFQDWSGVSMEEFICRLDAYLRYYNESRIKQSLGWLSPNQYRRSLGLAA